MATIPNTRIGTSDPPDLCKGFALFPMGDDVRSGAVFNRSTKDLFRVSPQILVFKLNANATCGLAAGCCGPGYGLAFTASGATNGNQLSLTVNDDKIVGGFFAGASAGFNVNIQISRLQVSWNWDGWNSGIKTSWTSLGSINVGVNVDFLGTILDILLQLIAGSDSKAYTLFQKVQNLNPALLASWGFYDEKQNTLPDNSPNFFCEPSIAIPIDIVPYVEALNGIAETLKALYGSFTAGPQISIDFPLSVTPSKFTIDGVEFGNVQATGRTFTATGSGPISDNPQNIAVELTHTPGIDIGLGVFMNLTVMKFFSVPASISFDLLSLFNISVNFGPFKNSVNNTVGSMTIPGSNETAMKADPHGFIDFDLQPEPAYA